MPLNDRTDAPATIIAPSVIDAARAMQRNGSARLLGIVGAPAAGKSTLAVALSEALALVGDVVAQDGFHLSERQLARLGLADRKGAPETFDGVGYAQLLSRIAAHRAATDCIYAPGFNRAIEEPIAAHCSACPADGLIITEGNYLLLADAPWPAVRAQLDAVWYLHCETAEREARLVKRHCYFGRCEADALAWMAHTDRPNAERIEAAASRADRRLTWTGNRVDWAQR